LHCISCDFAFLDVSSSFFLEVYDFIERHNLAACEITEPAAYQFCRNYQTKQGPYKEDKTTDIA
jgi:hypothetical protein